MTRNKDKQLRKQLTSEYQERERVMGVYQITNTVNGRIFVGSSNNLDSLWNKEKFMLEHGTHINKELQRDWKQFGGEKFEYLVLETVKHEQQIRYDYKDVFVAEGREPADVVRQYKREVDQLKEKWMEKLQPFGVKGYH